MADISIEVQVKSLPNEPGVYQYYDREARLLYIGKAKNIKKRVSSYFNKSHDNQRIQILVSKIKTIQHIVVETETDALLLENSLIKKHQPRFNILLKDDKTYPWICIKKERFPRVFMTRRMVRDGSEYFGPYTSPKTIRVLLDLIHGLYTLRTCNYELSSSNIEANRYKVCLEYHLKNCKGACEGFESESSYLQTIEAIRYILKGNFKESLGLFKNQMLSHADRLEFEEAQVLKEKIQILENYQAKSTVVNPKITHIDVFTILSDDTHGYVNFLQISYGAIIRSHTTEIKKKLDESDKELLEYAILALRDRFALRSNEIYVPFTVSVGADLKVTIPMLGDKKKLLDLSMRNAKYYRKERFNQLQIIDPDRHTNRLMAQMKTDLRLPSFPRHIECFDNSNIQGTNPVAACVVFKNGKPAKKAYRKFNIQTVTGANDFASMEEVVYRRYKRLKDEKLPLPQLIIVDGGKGQLRSGIQALESLGLRNKITIIGIAKRLEEIYYPDDPVPMYLDKKSETLKVIQQLRNEAHRFGINFHRQKRSKAAIQTELDTIPGIGEKTTISLLRHFRSVAKVQSASIQELTEIIGKSRANKVFQFYQANQLENSDGS